MKTFEQISEQWMKWSVKKFEGASALTSLNKARKEIAEAEYVLRQKVVSRGELATEYADIWLCLLHSAARAGYTAAQVIEAIGLKAEVNYERKWKQNEDGSYSHIKS